MSINKTVIDGRQLRAGRIILRMTVRGMAEACGLNRNSILRVEAHETLPRSAWAADRIAAILQERGIVFTVEDGKAGVMFQAAAGRGRKPYGHKTGT
jgi:DNA-binding XRE family transcriptional regulator